MTAQICVNFLGFQVQYPLKNKHKTLSSRALYHGVVDGGSRSLFWVLLSDALVVFVFEVAIPTHVLFVFVCHVS